MYYVLTEGCHVGYFREFVGTVFCTFGQSNTTIVIIIARPVHIQSNQYRLSCSTVNNVTTRGARGATPGIHPDGEQPKTALWLWVREITWYLYTRGVRGRMKAKQRWFQVTRELWHKWFHHFRHHVHDGHWTGEFTTIIWRLHCFTVSFRGDVRGESGPRKLASVNWRTAQWARGQFTRTLLYQTGSKNGAI